jgi:hypothetical protein
MVKLDAFTTAYLEAALWTADPNPGSGEYCADLSLIPDDFRAQAIEDCAAFQDTYADQLSEAGTAAQNGHDFWLTRNGHGAGFWDRGYPQAISDALTDGAHAYGETDLYVPEWETVDAE